MIVLKKENDDRNKIIRRIVGQHVYLLDTKFI